MEYVTAAQVAQLQSEGKKLLVTLLMELSSSETEEVD